MQAKDIPDDQLLSAVRLLTRSGLGARRWDVARLLGVPDKIVLAKARTLDAAIAMFIPSPS